MNMMQAKVRNINSVTTGLDLFGAVYHVYIDILLKLKKTHFWVFCDSVKV